MTHDVDDVFALARKRFPTFPEAFIRQQIELVVQQYDAKQKQNELEISKMGSQYQQSIRRSDKVFTPPQTTTSSAVDLMDEPPPTYTKTKPRTPVPHSDTSILDNEDQLRWSAPSTRDVEVEVSQEHPEEKIRKPRKPQIINHQVFQRDQFIELLHHFMNANTRRRTRGWTAGEVWDKCDTLDVCVRTLQDYLEKLYKTNRLKKWKHIYFLPRGQKVREFRYTSIHNPDPNYLLWVVSGKVSKN